MAEINFKELYLTEYTRLVNAIHRAFSETEGLETIEDLADYFRDLSIKSKATLDLNNATWNGNVCTYNANGFEITVVRDSDVVAENIREEIVIDGVEGTLVDLTGADWGERPNAASIDTGVIIKWFNGASIEPIKGTGGTARESGKVFTFDDFNVDDDLMTLKDDSDHPKAYSAFKIQERSLKNTDLTIGYNGSTMTLTVPRGMTLDGVSREINRLTDSEQSDLQGKLLSGQSFLGVTSNNSHNINTRVVVDAEVMTAKDVKSGKKGFVNGKAIEGNMQPLGDPLSWNEAGVSPSVITIPADRYTDAAHTYTFTNIKPNTLKTGSSIEFDGTTITGSLETVTYDDYEGATDIQLGSEMPENLATENRHVQSDIRFNLDADTITSSNIRYGARVLGVDGNFSYALNDPDSNQLYVTLDDQTTTLDSGEEVYQSPDIKANCSAFINGKRVIGTSTTLSEGQTMNAPQIELNENFPTIENVDGKQMVGNIQFILDGDVITPSNIRSGATILGTEGTFTNIEGNAATASDILSDQRAYVNGAEITGTMPNNGSPTLKAAWNTDTSLDGGYYGSIEVAPVRMYDQGNLVKANDEIASRIQTGVTIGTSNTTSITGTGNLVVEARQESDISRVQNKIGTVIKIVNNFGNYQQGSTYIVVSNGEVRKLIDYTTLNQATAGSDHVLSTKKYYSNYGSLGTGTMPNKTGWTATLSNTKEVVVPKGYHDGTQKVSVDTNNWAGVIKQGESLLGVQGTYTPKLETATLTINNETHYPMWGVGFSHVTVSVPEKQIGKKANPITANGTYNITDTDNNSTELDGWNSVKVEVPLDETTFEANGEFSYSGTGGWKKVTVAVPLDEETFTTNGDYSHPNGGWSTVHVNVQPRLQSKTVTAPVVGSEPVAPDEGYYGLSSVTVQAPSYSLADYEIGPDTWATFEDGTTTIIPPSDKIGFRGITLQADTYIISGTNPYQGTATASDIALGKTAVANGSLVTGTMGPVIERSPDGNYYVISQASSQDYLYLLNNDNTIQKSIDNKITDKIFHFAYEKIPATSDSAFIENRMRYDYFNITTDSNKRTSTGLCCYPTLGRRELSTTSDISSSFLDSITNTGTDISDANFFVAYVVEEQEQSFVPSILKCKIKVDNGVLQEYIYMNDMDNVILYSRYNNATKWTRNPNFTRYLFVDNEVITNPNTVRFIRETSQPLSRTFILFAGDVSYCYGVPYPFKVAYGDTEWTIDHPIGDMLVSSTIRTQIGYTVLANDNPCLADIVFFFRVTTSDYAPVNPRPFIFTLTW